MRLNATIALDGLSIDETEAEDVIERIRVLLGEIDPNVNVFIELFGVGTEFGKPVARNDTDTVIEPLT